MPSQKQSTAMVASSPQPFVQEMYPTVWDDTTAKDQIQFYRIHASIETKSGPYEEIAIERIDFNKKNVDDIVRAFTHTSEINTPPKDTCSVIKVEESEYEVLWQNHFFSIQRGSNAILQPERWVLRGNAYPDEPAGTQLERVNIEKEQAESIAQDFLSEIGVTGYTCAFAEKARLLKGEPPFNTFSEGWWLIFVKEYEHYIPLAYDGFNTNLPELQLERMNRIAPYRQDAIWALVNEEGCQMLQWHHPTRIVRQADSGIGLLPFAEVQEIIDRLLTEGARAAASEGDRITVTKLTLCAGMTGDPDDPNAAKLIPMWAVSYTTENMITEGRLPGLLCIDARTGEAINPLIY